MVDADKGVYSDDEQTRRERSARVVALFNAARGVELSKVPGPIPPFTRWLDGKIVSASRGSLEINFLVRPEMANPTGLLHGGVQCGMMDDVVGMTTATLGYAGFLISIDFHVNYLGKVRVGEEVAVRAKVNREGKRIVHASAEITRLGGGRVASGSTNLLVTGHTPDYVKEIES
ncbi:MAG: PaaI family thioesterase [Promethearchaeota archaeon]